MSNNTQDNLGFNKAEFQSQAIGQKILTKIANSAMGVVYAFRLRPDGSMCFPYASPNIEKICGVRPEDLIETASPIFDRIYQKNLHNIQESILQSARTMSAWQNEFRFEHPSKGQIWLEGRSMPELEADGSILWTGFFHDITKRKLIEHALRQWGDAFEHCAHGIAIGNPITNCILICNPAFAKMNGRAVEEIMGTPILTLYDPTDHENVKNFIAEADRLGQISYEILMKRKDETMFPVQVDLVSVRDEKEKILYRVATVQDITNRKRAEEALRISEEKFSKMFHSNPVALFILSEKDQKIIDLNKIFEELTGYSAKEAIGKTSIELGIRRDSLERQKYIETLVKTGHVHLVETEVYTKSGDTRKVLFSAELISLGKEACVLCMIIDITERKRAQEQLQKFISLSPSAIYALKIENGQYKHIWASENIVNLIGYKAEEHSGEEWWLNQVHPEDRKRLTTSLQQFIEKGSMHIEYRFKRKDGKYIWLRDEQKTIPNQQENRNELVGVLSDVTERIELEEQFRQAQKMEAIGQLSGGVAHDFNNILTVIQGYISLLELRNLISPQIQIPIEEIKIATNRAANLTRQLLLFSRRQTLQLSEIELNEVVTLMSKMLQRILGEDIEMKHISSSKPLPLYADVGMIDQILLNLAVNSRDAMPNGGILTIVTSEVTFTPQSLPLSIHAQVGTFACLTVSDTGCGIAKENIQRIFEPFFTTKETGKGTGLGLATVFGIVQNHQGWIEVFSEIDKGTTFQIYLPILNKANKQNSNNSDSVSEGGGNETILIVEDEQGLRTLIEIYLSDLGYHVIGASTGAAALELWKQHKDEIHLVITDLVMPGDISGVELAKQLIEENPKLKIIYTSGYSLEFINKNIQLREKDVFLVKPYNPVKLAQTIRSCLDS